MSGRMGKDKPGVKIEEGKQCRYRNRKRVS